MNGLRNDESLFIVTAPDRTEISENEANWSDFSELKIVDYFGMKKQVMVATIPIASIQIKHAGLTVTLDVPEDCEVFQATRSRLLVVGGEEHPKVLGRCVGLVRDGEVIEEQFLNGLQQEVLGMKK